MAYAQLNYQQRLGNSNLTIAEAGCFCTADANLLADIGVTVDPAALNDFYIKESVYQYDADDRANDDLFWGSASRYDGRLKLVQTGSGWPDSNLAEVKFHYQSISHPTLPNGQPNMITHFCKVADWQNHKILDSWDGLVKNPGRYGEPVAFAKFDFEQPAPAPTPEPTPAPQATYTYERLPQPLRVRVKPNCNLWNLNYSGGYANAQAIAQLSTDPSNLTEFTAVGKATKQDFADHPVYFMSTESFGEADVTGVPAFNQGVNTVDLEPAPAPTPVAEVAAAPEPVVDGDKVEVKVLPPNPDAWKASFKTNSSGDYIAKASVVVHDVEGKAEDMQLVKGQTVHVAGDFTGPDGVIKYYRTVNATNGYTDEAGVKHAPNWRGIPIESLEEDDSIFTIKDDVIDDFKEMRGYIGTRQKAIIAAAKIHGEVNWLASRLKKKGDK